MVQCSEAAKRRMCLGMAAGKPQQQHEDEDEDEDEAESTRNPQRHTAQK